MALNTWHILQSPIPIPLTAHNTPPAPPFQKKCEVWSVRVLIVAPKNVQCGEIYSLSSWFWQHSINGPCSYHFVTITWTTSHIAEQGKNTSHFTTKYAKSVLCTGYTIDIFLWQKDLQVSSMVVCFSCCSCTRFFFFVSLFCSVLLSFPNSKIYWMYCYVNIVTYVDHFGCSGNSAQRTSSDWLVPSTW